jgi:Uma2 family endonuclease
MTQPKPRIKFTVKDYMTVPEDKRYQLLDGELILAPSPVTKHQRVLIRLAQTLIAFVTSHHLGEVFIAPYDVFLSEYDVVQPDILFVCNTRFAIITEANIQGAPDLVVEVLSPGTARYDLGYKQTLYSRHGVREYWQVDPDAETVAVLTESPTGLALTATYQREQELRSPLLESLTINLEQVFAIPDLV